MRSSQSQGLPIAQISRENSLKYTKDTAKARSGTNPSLLGGCTQTKINGCHRISFHPPSPSLHFSPRLNDKSPDSCSFGTGKNAQSLDLPLVEHSPITSDKPGATVNDGLFLALMMKNISTPTLVSTSNKGVLSSNSQPFGSRGPSTSRNDKKVRSAYDKKAKYFDVGVERNISDSSGSTEASAKFGLDGGEATVRSFLDFLEKCDAEFLRETARLSESIKYTKNLIKQVREERLSDWTDSGDSEAGASSSDEECTPVMRYTGREGSSA